MGFLPLTSTTGGTSLVGEVQAHLLNRVDLPDARCVAALNFAQAEISRLHDFKELKNFYGVSTFFSTDPFNDMFIPLAPMTKHIHTMILRDGVLSRKLRERPWRMFDKAIPAPDALARSRSLYYSRWNQQCILYPVPDAVYPILMRITTYPRPFDLSQPQAKSDYEWKDDMLIKLAAAYLWKAFGRPDKANDLEIEVFGPDPTRVGGIFAASIKQDTDMPDMEITQESDISVLGKYWADPFVKSSP